MTTAFPPRQISTEKWYHKLSYTPRVSQAMMEAAIAAGKRYVSYFAPPRVGKSYGAAKIAGRRLLPLDHHSWIVAPNYKLGSKEFRYIWTDLAETGILKMADRRNFDIRGGNMRIQFPWGSFLEVVSEENPASLRAEELDTIILAEASELSPDTFDRHLFARAEKRKALTVIPTTPHGYNWVYHKFRLPSCRTLAGGRPNEAYDPLMWSVVVSADPALIDLDNPALADVYEPGIYDDDYLARAKRTLPRPIYLEQVGGCFASYAGLIYTYDPDKHRVAPFTIPDSWTHIVGWDHGASAPTAIMLGSYAPDGTLYWWGEIYETGLSARQYWDKARRMLGSKQPAFIAIDRSAKQVRIELEAIGVATTTPEQRDIRARIIKKTQLMADGKWKVLAGQVPHLEKEALSWEYEDTPTDADGESIDAKPKARQACHALDATGYAELIPVGLPQGSPQDPYAVAGDNPETAALWRAVRKHRIDYERDQQQAGVTRLLGSDPFEEEMLAAFADAGMDTVDDGWWH